MGRENLQNVDANRGHEPAGIPLNRPSAFARPTADEPGTFSPTGEEGEDEGVRFTQKARRVATERRMQRGENDRECVFTDEPGSKAAHPTEPSSTRDRSPSQ